MKKTLYYGGNIITCDKSISTAEAVLTENGKILKVGEKESLCRLYPDADLFDLEGKTLLPGFIDGHSHLSGVGAAFRKCDLKAQKAFTKFWIAFKRSAVKKTLPTENLLSAADTIIIF